MSAWAGGSGDKRPLRADRRNPAPDPVGQGDGGGDRPLAPPMGNGGAAACQFRAKTTNRAAKGRAGRPGKTAGQTKTARQVPPGLILLLASSF